MFNNSFLIVDISPANNELNVPLNKSMSVRFAMDMDVNTITNGTLLLSQVNGNAVPCTVTYERTARTAYVTPNQLLDAGVEYRLTVLGGASGILTVTGVVLPETRSFEFITAGDIIMTAPTNLTTSVIGGKVSISWLQPDQYNPLDVPQYEAYVSTSNLDPDADSGAIVWPLASDSISLISQTSINVGKDLNSGNYYVYVRGVDQKQSSPWVFSQIYVEPAVVSGGGSSNNFSVFEVVDTYPKMDTVNIMPNTIKVLFTNNIDIGTINPQSVYVIKSKKPSQLGIIDLMTTYSFANGLAYMVDAPVQQNLLSLSIDPAVFSKNSEYVLVIRETVKDTSGNALGEAYSLSFTTTYEPLFGDPNEIKEDVKGFLSDVPDKILYAYMSNVSQTAYDTVFATLNATGAADSTAILGNPPRYLQQYVRVKTAYELLVNAFLERSSSAGSVRTLGELTIDNSNTPDITKILAAFKDRIKPWEDQLHGQHNRGYAKPTTAIKGETGAAYPAQYTRNLKDVQA